MKKIIGAIGCAMAIGCVCMLFVHHKLIRQIITEKKFPESVSKCPVFKFGKREKKNCCCK